MSAPAVPLADQVACLERELGLRRRVYPRLVQQGRLTQDAADRELARMAAALDTVRAAALAEAILGGMT